MMGVSSGCGLCPWSCSGKVGAYVKALTDFYTTAGTRDVGTMKIIL